MLKRWPCKVWDGDRQAFNNAVVGKKGYEKHREKLNAACRRRWAAKPKAELSWEQRCALKAQKHHMQWYEQLADEKRAEACKVIFDDFVLKKGGRTYRCAVCDKHRPLSEVRKWPCRPACSK
jgi:hypothetical protein